MSSCQRTVTHRNIWNVPSDALMCPLQIINQHWSPIIDPSWSKRDIYLSTTHPMSKITWAAISQKPINQIKQFKKLSSGIYFYTCVQFFGSKIQNTNGQKSLLNFLTSEKLALNGPTNGPMVIWSQFLWLFGGLRCSNVSSTNHQLTLKPYHQPFMV